MPSKTPSPYSNPWSNTETLAFFSSQNLPSIKIFILSTGKLGETRVRSKREFLRDKEKSSSMISRSLRPYGLAVRTPPFHGGSPGSIPGRVANSFSLKHPVFKTPVHHF